MELRHLRYFVAAAEEQHMTRASERLRISQPALSEQIRELEADLGLRLFERVARGIRLSSAGREFLERARAILADVELARERAFHAERGEVGRLRLAFNEIAGQQRAVGQAVQRFHNAYPAIELDITQMAGHE
jgi:DNA-binding transcriptional LysR family regulator